MAFKNNAFTGGGRQVYWFANTTTTRQRGRSNDLTRRRAEKDTLNDFRLKMAKARSVFRTDLIAASIHDEYDFDVSWDRNRTVVYLEFIDTRKIDQKICQNSIRSYSSRILVRMRLGVVQLPVVQVEMVELGTQ